SKGDLVIMSPTGGETGNRNIDLAYQLQAWNRRYKKGIAFDSSTGFKLPSGSTRSPDASWIPLEKWDNLTNQEKQKFLPLSPDFIIELLSPTDNLIETQKKMLEYLENGTKLGWLINRKTEQVEIYRLNQEVEILDNPSNISGENILVDFVLEMEFIW
ncbi:Uma2 family endonuclease, partial [Geminocystis sp. GBBB08]|uniref:Uma2 family endonuclease n=1 Tax=Geminocystis sp. GBBB08 TaxID=2604140 RepID=UPI0027E32F69